MSVDERTAQSTTADPTSDVLVRLIGMVFAIMAALIALPLLVPFAARRLIPDVVATKTKFWMIWKWQWLANTIGIVAVAVLITVEGFLIVGWVNSGDARAIVDGDRWSEAAMSFLPWAVVNFLAGALLLPVVWSWKRRRIAEQVRLRRVSNVLLQERIEGARKRASDADAARRIGVHLNTETGRITGVSPTAITVPFEVAGRQSLGIVNRATISSVAERFHDVKSVRDWVDPTGDYLVLPQTSSSVRALIIAESGSGKTVLINGLVLCAIEQGWPVFVLDAKGDPADAEQLVAIAEAHGRTATIGGKWDFFNGTAEQVTAKLMRLMPAADGANQYYLDEIRGVLQAIQDGSPIRSVADLKLRLSKPGDYVRDQFDLTMVNQTVDRNGTTAAARVMQALLVALRPLEKWIDEDGWSYTAAPADVTVVPLSPVDDSQAKLGDLLMLDLRNFLAGRLERRDKTPVVVIVDEFPQLVTGAQDPGDTAGSLFETARSAGVGLVLATQSPAGLSNDDTRRRRALTSGAALIFGRSKDPEDIVKYAGSVLRMESSTSAQGNEQGSGRAQHSYVIPPQDVREAADGAFWLVQAGAIAPFRALPHATIPPTPTVSDLADADLEISDESGPAVESTVEPDIEDVVTEEVTR